MRERLGALCHNTRYRAARRTALLEEQMGRLGEQAEHANAERERRAHRAEVQRLVVQVRDEGRWELVPQLAAARRRLDTALHGPARSARRASTARCANNDCAVPGAVDADGRCAACGRTTCPRCGDLVGATPHRCDPATVESVAAIAHGCRPCARCGVPSARVEGCPVMWCVHCHAFWHWEDGRVLESRRGDVPHNPDHRAWLATAGRRDREVDDLPCGGLPTVQEVSVALVRDVFAPGLPHNASFVVSMDALLTVDRTLLPALNAMRVTQRLRHTYPCRRAVDPFAGLRLAFLLGDLPDESAFAHALERHERSLAFRAAVGEVLATLVLSTCDVLQRLCAPHGPDSFDVAGGAMRALRDVTNAALADVERLYQRKTPRLTDEWRWSVPCFRHLL